MRNLSDDQLLELLDLYIDMTEKQDETISKLSRIVARQATELAHLRSVMNADLIANKTDE